jgi:hypothetical protein
MTTAEDIEKAVEQLAPCELARFRAWFEAFDAEQFDAAIEPDIGAGNLMPMRKKLSPRTAPGEALALREEHIREQLIAGNAHYTSVGGLASIR